MADTDRRHYQRITFNADIQLKHKHQQWPCHLVDISLKGVLIESPENTQALLNDCYTLELILGENEVITMEAKISHTENNHWGLEWMNIEVDSFTHLRKLLELNTQDPDKIYRELSELG